jgi:hypothetical protein
VAAPKRGSAKWLKERTIPEREVDELLKLTQSEGELLHWFPLGQPNPDGVFGTVRLKPNAVGPFIGRLVAFERLRLRLDVFPYGIPVPDEVLVSFEHARLPGR